MNPKSLTKAERRIYQEARELISRQISAPELSARLFGPGGLLKSLWKTESERKVLVKSELYKFLQEEVSALRRREVVQFEREVTALSGRLTVVVPKSLHAALKREAADEGVSLSELIRLKLGVSYMAMLQATVQRRELERVGEKRSAH